MSETLENAKGNNEDIREVYASLYLNAVRQQIEEYKGGCVEKFDDVDEEVLEGLDEIIEPWLEEMYPDLYVKRVGGFDFLVMDWEKVEEKILDTEE
jgi:hypothetical protein